jgi:uncharacterized protein YndB with AHSA1/START domain
MVAGKSETPSVADREMAITRLINAPRELLWEAWTDPARLAVWWGPRGFRTTTHTMDFRVGGLWRYTMHGPDGVDYPNLIVYRELKKPERMVYDHSGEGDFDETKFHTTVTFEKHGAKTKVTMRSVFPTKEELAHVIENFGALEGGKQHLARLEEQAAIMTGPILEIERLFNAPRALVWKAWTEKDRLAQWWGPKGLGMASAELDLRPGGRFLYCMRTPQGQEMWGKFEFRDVIPPQRLVFVNSFSDKDGGITRHPFSPEFAAKWPAEVLNVMTLTEAAGGKTKLLMHGAPLNATEEQRAFFISAQTGVRQGFGATFDQLEEYLAKAGR